MARDIAASRSGAKLPADPVDSPVGYCRLSPRDVALPRELTTRGDTLAEIPNEDLCNDMTRYARRWKR